MGTRSRILIFIMMLAGGYYIYDAFMDYRSKPPVDAIHRQQADKVRSQLP